VTIRSVAKFGGWAVILGWLVGAVLVLTLGPGCGPIPPPVLDCRVLGCPAGSHCAMDDTVVPAVYKCVPDPPPACDPNVPCGHGMWCPDPAAGCVPIPAPGPVCNPGETCGCWVFPADEDDWRELACAPREGFTNECVDRGCVYTAIPPVCPPTCPEGQVCTDPEAGCVPVVPPDPGGTCGLREADLVASTCPAQQFAAENKRGTTALGPDPGGSPAANLEALASWFRSQGWCAIAGSEALFVLRDDGKVEERHSVYFGDGSWTNSGSGKFVGCHVRPAEAPVATACPPPLPNRAQGKLKIGAKAHGRWVDSTIQTVMTCDYCRAIGLGCYGPDPPCSPLRCGCPMRAEGDPYRFACEMYAAGGGTVWQADPPGSIVELNDGNPWQARTNGQRLRVCVLDLSICSAWVDQP
jgi:hypothetical protein